MAADLGPPTWHRGDVEPGTIARHVQRCESNPPHDDGDLTSEHGFLPRRLDHTPLGGVHEAWEQMAAQLSQLAFNPRVRDVFSQLPLLSAALGDLPDNQVKRAATLLGLLAHSYWRFGLDRMFIARNSDIPDQLPEAILRPWAQVCRRLGRVATGLTLEDWAFTNFTFVDPAQIGADGRYRVTDIRNETIKPAVPVYGSEAERVFTSAFTDVHAPLAPAVRAVIGIEQALGHGLDGHELVAASLETIARCTTTATRAFRRVGPHRGNPTHCDHVDWAKTVVTWAVPPPGWPTGPSGSATPLVHLLDAVVGRTRYDSRLGVFAAGLRTTQLPRKHELFCDLTRALDIRAYVEGLRTDRSPSRRESAGAFDLVVEAFAGTDGFLGVHKGKVVDYLQVGTVVGRNQSTAHDQTYLADASWVGMADDLTDALAERQLPGP